jgi:hypothetical protein
VPFVTKTKIYLLHGERDMMSSVALSALLKLPNSIATIPAIQDFLAVPNLPEAMFLISSSSASELAAELRARFPQKLFVIASADEIDGLLPKAAWDFLNARKEQFVG